MSKVTDKFKEKLKGAKDKVTSTTKEGASTTKEKMTDAKDKVTSSAKEIRSDTSSSNLQNRKSEEGTPGTEAGRKDDPLTQYRAKEAMTPAKEKEHEPTAVKRDPSDQKIVEPGQVGTNPKDAAERARRSGMTKGTAGATDSGSDYEQGAGGANE
ncbi:MAG: hypothetical protein JO297_09730 [Nitrososphaeraceae archaeon]|nr:hypothetical protein [Nitrososphaeraceae archaeon]